MDTAIGQRSLFDGLAEDVAKPDIPVPDLSSIVGLKYIRDFIGQEKHDNLLREVDSQPWLTDLKRQVQHYGYRYDYKARRVSYSMRLGPLPAWAAEIAELLCDQRLVPESPDQVIVNEYQPGQGIASHIDCQPCFTDTIISLSLGSPCVMDFTHTQQIIPVLLESRSIVVLQAEARYKWLHGIRARKTDQYHGKAIKRDRRVSLTFRKVIID